MYWISLGIELYSGMDASTGAALEPESAVAIPASLDEIDVQWTRDVLTHATDVDSSLLCSLKQEPLGGGRGFVGQLVRLHLE